MQPKKKKQTKEEKKPTTKIKIFDVCFCMQLTRVIKNCICIFFEWNYTLKLLYNIKENEH